MKKTYRAWEISTIDDIKAAIMAQEAVGRVKPQYALINDAWKPTVANEDVGLELRYVSHVCKHLIYIFPDRIERFPRLLTVERRPVL